jgi:3-oxoacyl-[acyl-carrier protein] reductase
MNNTKLVVVSGASQGLGLAISESLLKQGYRVLGLSRQHSAGLVELANSYPQQLDWQQCDLADLANIPQLCRDIVKHYGRPYALINNAAIGHDGILATMHDSEIDQVMRLNIQSPILMTKYLTRPMLLNQEGRVVNISSIIANTGFNGLSVYAASKAALQGFTGSLARELGKASITVNSVAPGFLETQMTEKLEGDQLDKIRRRTPLSKLASPHQAASAVCYLLSEEASAITGTTITVDAGSTA